MSKRRPNPPIRPKPSISTPRKFKNTNSSNTTTGTNTNTNTNNTNTANIVNSNNVDNNQNDNNQNDNNNSYSNRNGNNDDSNHKNDENEQYMKSDSFSALFSTSDYDVILNTTNTPARDSAIEVFPQTEHFHFASPPQADKEKFYQNLIRQRNFNRKMKKRKGAEWLLSSSLG